MASGGRHDWMAEGGRRAGRPGSGGNGAPTTPSPPPPPHLPFLPLVCSSMVLSLYGHLGSSYSDCKRLSLVAQLHVGRTISRYSSRPRFRGLDTCLFPPPRYSANQPNDRLKGSPSADRTPRSRSEKGYTAECRAGRGKQSQRCSLCLLTQIFRST